MSIKKSNRVSQRKVHDYMTSHLEGLSQIPSKKSFQESYFFILFNPAQLKSRDTDPAARCHLYFWYLYSPLSSSAKYMIQADFNSRVIHTKIFLFWSVQNFEISIATLNLCGYNKEYNLAHNLDAFYAFCDVY